MFSNQNRMEKYDPLFCLIEAVGVSRSVVYKHIFDSLTNQLLKNSETVPKEILIEFLKVIVPLLAVPQLQPTILRVIELIGHLPTNYVQTVVSAGAFESLAISIKKQIWELDAKFFWNSVKKLLQSNDKEKLKLLSEYLQGSEKLVQVFTGICLEKLPQLLKSEEGSGILIQPSSLCRDVMTSLAVSGANKSQLCNNMASFAQVLKSIVVKKRVTHSELHSLSTILKSLIAFEISRLQNSIVQRKHTLHALAPPAYIERPVPVKRKIADIESNIPASSSVFKGGLEPWPVLTNSSVKLSSAALLSILEDAVLLLRRTDKNGIFSHPVTEDIAPNYFSIIKSPMDISTIQGRVSRGVYGSLSALEEDIALMLRNAMTYNTKGDYVYKEAVAFHKLWLTSRVSLYDDIASREKEVGESLKRSKTSFIATEMHVKSIEAARTAISSLTVVAAHIVPINEWPLPDYVNSKLSEVLNLSEIISKDTFNALLRDVVRRLSHLDEYGFFANPVTEDIAPNYFSIIKSPMDISTIQGRVSRGVYGSLSALEEDIALMLRNAMTYNTKGDYVYKEAFAIWKKWLSERLKYYERLYKILIEAQVPDSNDTPSVLVSEPVQIETETEKRAVVTADVDMTPTVTEEEHKPEVAAKLTEEKVLQPAVIKDIKQEVQEDKQANALKSKETMIEKTKTLLKRELHILESLNSAVTKLKQKGLESFPSFECDNNLSSCILMLQYNEIGSYPLCDLLCRYASDLLLVRYILPTCKCIQSVSSEAVYLPGSVSAKTNYPIDDGELLFVVQLCCVSILEGFDCNDGLYRVFPAVSESIIRRYMPILISEWISVSVNEHTKQDMITTAMENAIQKCEDMSPVETQVIRRIAAVLFTEQYFKRLKIT